METAEGHFSLYLYCKKATSKKKQQTRLCCTAKRAKIDQREALNVPGFMVMHGHHFRLFEQTLKNVELTVMGLPTITMYCDKTFSGRMLKCPF